MSSPATYDEPYADSSALPTYRLPARPPSRDVAASGDGGDESFAGYRRTASTRWGKRAARRASFRAQAPDFRPARPRVPESGLGAGRCFRRQTTSRPWARTSVDAYFHSVSVADDEMRGRL